MNDERDKPLAWDEISYIFRSKNRYNILKNLPDKFTEERELETRVDQSRATVHRSLRKFAQIGWADRDNTRFRRTPAGRITCNQVKNMLVETEVITDFSPLLRLGEYHDVEFSIDKLKDISSTRACDLNPAQATMKYHEWLDGLTPTGVQAFLGVPTQPVVTCLSNCPSLDDQTVLVETSGDEPVPELVESQQTYRECTLPEAELPIAQHVDIIVVDSEDEREAITAIRDEDRRVVATAHGTLNSFVNSCRRLVSRLEPDLRAITS